MHWKPVLLLSLAGPAMGLAAAFGLITGLEMSLWLVIGVVASLVIARTVRRRQFLHGFWAGMIGGAIAPLVLVLMWTTYVNSHPDLAVELTEAPHEFDPRLFVLAAAPLIAGFCGVTEGALAWGAGKMLRPRSGVKVVPSAR
jgi:hypothetical protein